MMSLTLNVIFIALNIVQTSDDSSCEYRYDVVSLNDLNYAIIDHFDDSIIIKGIDSNSYHNADVKIR